MVPDLLGAAVEYKAIKCTEKCTSKLTKMITDTTTFNKIRKEIEQNIAVYMKIPTRNLKDLLIVLAGTSSKQLLDNSDDLPKCKMIENEEDPFDCFQNVPGEFDYVNTVILKSQIKLPSIIGSTESVKFLRNLDLAENSLVFKSELVKYYLNYKWNKLLNLIIFQSLIVWSNIPLLISIIFIDSSNNYYIWAFIGTNSLLALIEITQIFVLGFPKYFGDSESKYAWTIIRMSSICLLGYLKFERIKVFEYLIFLVYSYCSYKISKKKKIPFITIISFIYSLVFWFGLENSFYTMIPMGSLLVLLFIITISFSNLKTEPWIPRLLFHALRLGVFIAFYFEGQNKFSLLWYLNCINLGIFIRCIHAFINLNQRDYIVLISDLLILLLVNLHIFLDYFLLINAAVLLISTAELAFYIAKIPENHKKTEYSTGLIILSLIIIVFDLSTSYYQFLTLVVINLIDVILLLSISELYFRLLTRNFFQLILNWNMLDSTRLAICGLWIHEAFYNPENLQDDLTFAQCFLTFIRGVTAFRAFSGTRYYVRLVFNSLNDIKFLYSNIFLLNFLLRFASRT